MKILVKLNSLTSITFSDVRLQKGREKKKRESKKERMCLQKLNEYFMNRKP